jgi:hypothetical protein
LNDFFVFAHSQASAIPSMNGYRKKSIIKGSLQGLNNGVWYSAFNPGINASHACIKISDATRIATPAASPGKTIFFIFSHRLLFFGASLFSRVFREKTYFKRFFKFFGE